MPPDEKSEASMQEPSVADEHATMVARARKHAREMDAVSRHRMALATAGLMVAGDLLDRRNLEDEEKRLVELLARFVAEERRSAKDAAQRADAYRDLAGDP